MVHDLEARRLFTQLFITGTGAGDGIDLSLAGQAAAGIDIGITNTGRTQLTVRVDDTAIALVRGATIRTEDILPGGVTRVRAIDLGGGSDRLVTDPAIRVRMAVSGGRGNDNLSGGGGRDFIDGGAGDDTLYGADANDALLGGPGNDSLLGQSGNDSLAGGLGDDSYVFGSPTSTQLDVVDEAVDAGSDMLDFGTNATPVVVDLANAAALADYTNGDARRVIQMAPGEPATNLEKVTGSGGSDLISGNSNANTIFGGGLNDTIFGADGADFIDGGSGNDELHGGAGDDYLSGAIGTDVVAGDADNDLVVDYSGSNNLSGGDGNDVFINQNGEPDTVDGGTGFDSVQDDDTDSITPGLQNDSFAGAEYVYDVIGGVRSQSAAPLGNEPAGLSAALVRAKMAASTVVVDGVTVALDARGTLRISGSAGDDSIVVTQVKRTVFVEVGRTAIPAFAPRAVRRIAIAGGLGNDSIRLVSARNKNPVQIDGVRVSGGRGDDTIVGGLGNDILAGELGNDVIDGGAGNDLLSGDFVVLLGETAPAAAGTIDGNDVISGGDGSADFVTYTYRTAPLTIDLRNRKRVSGEAGERDVILGVEYVAAGQNDDVLRGSAANDTIFGGPGNDRLSGGPGADRLLGGFGRDYIDPDDGPDLVDTGGNDGEEDTINGSLNADGLNPTSPQGLILLGTFQHDSNDYFQLVGRRYLTPE